MFLVCQKARRDAGPALFEVRHPNHPACGSRQHRAEKLSKGSVFSHWENIECRLLVIARSRIKSSEFGARNHSFRLTSTNSRPMTGVTSKDSKVSRTPLVFRGSRGYPGCVLMPMSSMAVVVKVFVAMINDADLHCYRVFRIPTERCHTYLLLAFATSTIPERICIERLMNSSSSACALAS